MEYFYSKTIDGELSDVYDRVILVLKEQGFGVITEIDIKKTMKEKLDVDFREYLILGACNPENAYMALLAEDKIGLLLPCNVIIQSKGEKRYEVSCVDPAVSMQMIVNPELESVAGNVRLKLLKAIDSL
jgi:uncharacterized protein (DUF302 family)